MASDVSLGVPVNYETKPLYTGVVLQADDGTKPPEELNIYSSEFLQGMGFKIDILESHDRQEIASCPEAFIERIYGNGGMGTRFVDSDVLVFKQLTRVIGEDKCPRQVFYVCDNGNRKAFYVKEPKGVVCLDSYFDEFGRLICCDSSQKLVYWWRNEGEFHFNEAVLRKSADSNTQNIAIDLKFSPLDSYNEKKLLGDKISIPLNKDSLGTCNGESMSVLYNNYSPQIHGMNGATASYPQSYVIAPLPLKFGRIRKVGGGITPQHTFN